MASGDDDLRLLVNEIQEEATGRAHLRFAENAFHDTTFALAIPKNIVSVAAKATNSHVRTLFAML